VLLQLFSTNEVLCMSPRLQEGPSEATFLPVEKIRYETKHTHVPAYAYPFAHELYGKAVLDRMKGVRGEHVALPGAWRNFVSWRDGEGRLHVCRPQDLPTQASVEFVGPNSSSMDTSQQGAFMCPMLASQCMQNAP
jgi:hypothetical protein